MNNHYHEMLAEAYEQEKCAERDAARSKMQQAWDRLTMPAVRLLVHVDPYPGENLESFMYRAVEHNALRSVAEIKRELGLLKAGPLSPKRHQQLSASLGGSYAAIAPMVPTGIDAQTVALSNHRLKKQHLVHSSSRICPLCVATQGYGKQEWLLAPLPVCEIHGTYLIDSCSCHPGAPLKSTRPRYTQCSCGSDLCHSLAIPASPAAHALACEVGRLFRQEPRGNLPDLPAGIAVLPTEVQLNDLLDLIVVLGNLDGRSGNLGLRMKSPVKRINAVIGQFEKAAHLISAWPGSLAAFLSKVPGWKSDDTFRLKTGRRLMLEPVEDYLTPILYRWFLDGQATLLTCLQDSTINEQELT